MAEMVMDRNQGEDPLTEMEAVLLPKRVYQELDKLSSEKGAAVEETVLDALGPLLKDLEIGPGEKEELHLELSEKYLKEAGEFLRKGKGVQAGEKAWEAAAQMVKAVAAGRGRELRSHSVLWEFVDQLSEQLKDDELLRLWHVANGLHINFYESWAPLHTVERGLREESNISSRHPSLVPGGG